MIQPDSGCSICHIITRSLFFSMTSNQPQPRLLLFPPVRPTPPRVLRRTHQANQPFAAKSTSKEPPSQQPRSNHHADARPQNEVNILARRSGDRFSWGSWERTVAPHRAHVEAHADALKKPSHSKGDRIRGHVRRWSAKLTGGSLSGEPTSRRRAETDASSKSAQLLAKIISEKPW